MKFTLITLIMSFSCIYDPCQAYTSIEKLKSFHLMDMNVAESLQKHLKKIEEHSNLVKQYLLEYSAIQEGEHLVENPLLSFQMVRRLVVNRKQIINSISNLSKDLVEKLEKSESGHGLSYTEHLQEVAIGLLRLQDTYLLHCQDVSQGKLLHLQSSARLTVFDTLLLATYSKDEGRLDYHVEWMEQTQRLTQLTPISDANLISQLYRTAKTLHDEVRVLVLEHAGKGNRDANIALERVLPNASDSTEPSKQRTNLIIERTSANNNHNEDALCHKGSLLSSSEASQMKCYFLHRSQQPFLVLFRFKVEVRAIQPLILTIYNVISDKEAEILKALATPKLKRSRVLLRGNEPSYSDQRISETSWLYDGDDPVVETISRRVALITGLKVFNSSQAMQVVNYGIGGMYKSHYDFFQKDDDIKKTEEEKLKVLLKDRIVTFLIYLSDVELGGATVFPLANIASPVIKGAATVWYNLNEAGVPNYSTLHGGCPVLYGSKWIANKWIEYHGQAFQKKCPVDKISHPIF